MDWPERMKAALDYIEGNLDDDISIPEAARIACVSHFYFKRLFTAITGMTLGEYIRKRRLTLAAAELTSRKAKVIDIALKYVYDSPDVFTRAFRNFHGVTPKAACEPGTKLAVCPVISFYIELKGGKEMDFRIIDKPGFPVAVVTRQFTTLNEQNFKDIPVWWQEFMATPTFKDLIALAGGKPGMVTGSINLGICFADDKPVDFSYSIAVELPERASAGKFEKKQIPSANWAVFDCTLTNLQNVTRRIFSEWFPSTGYEHADAPELEVYLPHSADEPMPVQIWIPVKKK